MSEITSNKYERVFQTHDRNGIPSYCLGDVYTVLEAFKVNCPGIQHAVKKLLCCGLRGSKSALQDLEEAKQSIERAIELEKGRTK